VASSSFFYYISRAPSVYLSLVSASDLAYETKCLVVDISSFKFSYSPKADYSLALSSSMAVSRFYLNSSNLLTTFSRASAEKVLATSTKAIIGLDDPILANSAKTADSSCGSIVDNFSMINSSAPTTSTD